MTHDHEEDKSRSTRASTFMPMAAESETVRDAQATLGTIGDACAAHVRYTYGCRHACALADADFHSPFVTRMTHMILTTKGLGHPHFFR